MVLLQPRLNLKVTQKQILTPGLVQMVSVLALNKLELKDMINAEIVENPVLEELDSSVPLLDEVAQREEDRERAAEDAAAAEEKKDPFDEIDFGSFFRDYLDPGFRSRGEMETVEKPSFENFLSRPTTLTDHLMWQLGAMHVKEDVRQAAELVIGNLNEDGYLTGSEDELLGISAESSYAEAATHAAAGGIAVNLPSTAENASAPLSATSAPVGYSSELAARIEVSASVEVGAPAEETTPPGTHMQPQEHDSDLIHIENSRNGPEAAATRGLNRAALREAIELVRQMDPMGVAARDLRECLLAQLHYHQQLHQERKNGSDPEADQLLADSLAIVNEHLHALQNKHYKEIAKAIGRPVDEVMKAVDLIRTLDPKPGLRYNKTEPTLIEPDVAFIKQGDEYLVLLNEDDIPQLRLSPTYKRLLQRDAAERDVRNYVKERYKSAIQLIKNIEQRKQTILKVCYAIIGRQREFLDRGIDHLKPMMIKEVAEEIGVHPSTVSRAVANKYAHTAQGVYELRYFFSESVNGPEGGSTSLLILKRRVKKLIEEEDPARPLTDEQITRILQSQGIQVTRRTVAKYREDMRIPSTHQRRVKN